MRMRKGVGTAYLAVLALAVTLTFLLTFSFTYGFRPVTTTTTVNSNQVLVNSLQSQNAQLQRELATATRPSNSTSQGLDSVRIYQADSDGVVTVQGTESSGSGSSTILGSGFAINFSNAYYIVTNYHVVKGVTGVTVTFRDGDAYPATIVGSDGYSDMAVLKVDAPLAEFSLLNVVSSSELAVGQPVAAIGNPFGLSGSMTIGIVSQLGRTISESLAGNFAIANVIQFSAAINPGNSGGPLLDANGAVVGITTATVVSSQGVGFAIPSDTLLRELPSLIATGSFGLHPYMGISTVDMSYQLAQYQKSNVTYGALVESVNGSGPAQVAGIRGGTQTVTIDGTTYSVGGDIIVGINETKIVNTDALSSYLAEYALAGQTVVLQIIRGGQTMSVSLVLGTRPPAPSA